MKKVLLSKTEVDDKCSRQICTNLHVGMQQEIHLSGYLGSCGKSMDGGGKVPERRSEEMLTC
jgi:hypothetical protein